MTECNYCGSEALAYGLRSDRGQVVRCIPCLAIEQGQQQFRTPFDEFINNEKHEESPIYDSRERWDESRRMSYESARDWYKILARIVQDDPILKRDPEDFGTVNEHTRSFLTNIMGEDAHYPPSEIAGNKVSPGQMTFDNLGEDASDSDAKPEGDK